MKGGEDTVAPEGKSCSRPSWPLLLPLPQLLWVASYYLINDSNRNMSDIFICWLLHRHLFFICFYIWRFTIHIQIPPLKALRCWRQRCFPLVSRAILKPNVQINLKPEVYARWMFLQQFSYLPGQNVTKQQGHWESRNPLNVPWTSVFMQQ